MIIRIHPYSGVRIYLQIVQQLTQAIESGALRPGEQLPPIRTLAREPAPSWRCCWLSLGARNFWCWTSRHKALIPWRRKPSSSTLWGSQPDEGIDSEQGEINHHGKRLD